LKLSAGTCGTVIASNDQHHWTEEDDAMAATWGLCKKCKWWQIEPDAQVADTTKGLCIDEDLQPFQLLVSGDSGCNHYMLGEPARARGSSGHPPTAKPAR
jgi:hypothetical protein